MAIHYSDMAHRARVGVAYRYDGSYTPDETRGRLQAVADLLEGGWLQILDADGRTLANIPILAASVDAAPPRLRVSFPPKWPVVRSGTAWAGTLRGSASDVVADDMVIDDRGACDILITTVHLMKGGTLTITGFDIYPAREHRPRERPIPTPKPKRTGLWAWLWPTNSAPEN